MASSRQPSLSALLLLRRQYHHHRHYQPLSQFHHSPRPSKQPAFPFRNTIHNRTLIAPPRPGSGQLTERRPDRALPDIPRPWRMWARTLPIFLLIITVSALGMFNYQKQSSSVVASTLYALRTSERGRAALGDEIYFRDRFPWIWGEMNQLHGRIDIQFGVKGTKGRGMMRFKSSRRERMGFFETTEWSLTTEDGQVISLLDEGGKRDPFQGSILQAESSAAAAAVAQEV